jgi:hypothetical protein
MTENPGLSWRGIKSFFRVEFDATELKQTAESAKTP